MATTQIDAGRQVKAGTITDTQVSASAAINITKLNKTVIAADGTNAFTADQSLGTHKLTNVLDPTSPQDAATKAYVDAVATGLDVKSSVRAATTANGTLASSYANGSVIDSVTLATGNRVLLKDQTSGSENGVYTVNASGSPTRSTDTDSSAEVTPGMFTFVEEGTANADTGWILTNDGTVTLGTTALVFTQFSGAGSIIAGAGLTKTGNTLNVIAGDGSILVNADELHVQLADASLETVSGGVRVKHSTSPGDIYLGNASNVATPTTLGGDITSVSGTGSVVLAATIMRTAGFIDRETPSGSVNGSNTSFALANTPLSGSESVFLNGLLQEPGAGNDYTISTSTITYLAAPLTGDRVRVSYRK